MNHHRSRHGDDSLARRARLLDQRRGLPHRRLHLALGRNAVAHERERQPVALLRFGHHANAAHPGDHPVARLDVAQTPADGLMLLRWIVCTTIIASMR